MRKILLVCCWRRALSRPPAPRNSWRAANPIKNRYIVTLKNVSPDEVDSVAPMLAHAFNGRVLATMKHAMIGFGAVLTEPQAIALSRHPLVDVVEEDSFGHLSDEAQVFNFRTALESRSVRAEPRAGFLPRLLSVPSTCPWVGTYYRCSFTDDIRTGPSIVSTI